MTSTTSTMTMTLAPAPVPPAVERLHMRMGGCNPVLAAEAANVALVMDYFRSNPSSSSPLNASLTVRHADKTLLRVQEAGQDVCLAAGSRSCNAALSFWTPASNYDFELSNYTYEKRLVLGPDGTLVSGALDVGGTAHVRGDVVVSGDILANAYAGLVDDFSSEALFTPPTANALNRAFVTLSNLIASQIGFSNNSETTSNVDLNEDVTDALLTGPVACAELYVPRGGAVRAHCFCNLVHDVRRHPAMDLPPSAFALNAAYTQLSNHVQLQLREFKELAYAVHGFPAAYGDLSSTAVFGQFPSDLWLPSVTDGTDRFHFDSLLGHTTFALSNAAFVFVDKAAASAEEEVVLRVSRTGLSNAGGLSVGGSLSVAGNMSIAGGNLTVTDADAVLSRGPLRLSEGSVYLDRGSVLASNGCVLAAAYCNLPLATDQAYGIARLTNVPIADETEASNLCATAHFVQHEIEHVEEKVHAVQELIGVTLYAAYLASNVAYAASNKAFEYTIQRLYTSNLMTTGLHLTSLATDADAGVGVKLTNDTEASFSVTMAPASAQSRVTLKNATGGDIEISGACVGEARPPACRLSVGPVVTVRAGSAGSAASSSGATSTLDLLLPPDGMGPEGVLLPAVPGEGPIYACLTSSTFGTPWSAAPNAFNAQDEGAAWISAPQRYDMSTGAPTDLAASTRLFSPEAQTFIDVRGEWLQLESSQPLFATKVYLKSANPNYVPDDFILLGTTDAAAADGFVPLCAASATQGQRAYLIEGKYYDIDRDLWTTGFRAFRVLVTKVSITPAFSSFADVSQIDVFKLRGSAAAPTPDAMFIVNDMPETAFTVQRDGFVGIMNSSPTAPLHFSEMYTSPRTLVMTEKVSAEPNDHEFTGFGTESNALLYSVQSLTSRHVFRAGSNPSESVELMTVAYDQGSQAPLLQLRGTVAHNGRALLRPDSSLQLGSFFVSGADGNVGVNTQAPLCALDVRGVACFESLNASQLSACNAILDRAIASRASVEDLNTSNLFASLADIPHLLTSNVQSTHVSTSTLVASNIETLNLTASNLNVTTINYDRVYSNVTVFSSQEVRSNVSADGLVLGGGGALPLESHQGVDLGALTRPFRALYLRQELTLGDTVLSQDPASGAVTFTDRETGQLVPLSFGSSDQIRILYDRMRLITETFFSPVFMSRPSVGGDPRYDVYQRVYRLPDGRVSASSNVLFNLSDHVALYDYLADVTQYRDGLSFSVNDSNGAFRLPDPAYPGALHLEVSNNPALDSLISSSSNLNSNSNLNSVTLLGTLRGALSVRHSNAAFSTRTAALDLSYGLECAALSPAEFAVAGSNYALSNLQAVGVIPASLIIDPDISSRLRFFDSNVSLSVQSADPGLFEVTCSGAQWRLELTAAARDAVLGAGGALAVPLSATACNVILAGCCSAPQNYDAHAADTLYLSWS